MEIDYSQQKNLHEEKKLSFHKQMIFNYYVIFI